MGILYIQSPFSLVIFLLVQPQLLHNFPLMPLTKDIALLQAGESGAQWP